MQTPALVSPVGTIIDRQEVLSMSKKRVSHLRGERGQAFAELIRGVVPNGFCASPLTLANTFTWR